MQTVEAAALARLVRSDDLLVHVGVGDVRAFSQHGVQDEVAQQLLRARSRAKADCSSH